MGWNAKKGLGSLAMVMAVAFGGLASLPAQADVKGSKHDLTATTGGGVNKFTATNAVETEICVFCHTPHGADTTAAVPLWNRKMNSTYTTYDQLKTTTLDGAVLTVGSVSLACLSCHDGVTAMSTVINAPGSGNYDPAGVAYAGTWAGAGQNAGKLIGDPANNGISLIGQDLKNDHPIGIQYAGGGFYSTGGATPTSTGSKVDPDFVNPNSKALNGTVVWWVDTGGAGDTTRTKSDMILYTRTADSKDQPYVECASCHDPHVSGASNPTFLRIANTGSAVCLACHTK